LADVKGSFITRRIELVSRSKYQVIIHEIGSRWFIYVPAFSIHTQSGSLVEAEPGARDAISAMLGVDPRAFDVAISVRVSP
jgi:hypothetical protein